MRNLGPKTFQENSVLTEPLTNNGPLVARGNLKGPSIRVNGPFTVASDLEIEEYLRVNGPCIIRGFLRFGPESWAKINGPLKVDRGITGGSIKVNGAFNTEFAEIYALEAHGSVVVEADLIATDEIFINLGHSKFKKKLEVGGELSAPYIHIKNPGSTLDVLPGIRVIKKILRGSTMPKDKFRLSNLRIVTDHLVLEGVDLVDCEIDSDQVEEL
jgi:hypothetical protein